MKCILCEDEIHPKRLEIIPNTKTCVECSTETPKKGVTVVKGTGDHTWTDLMVMDDEQYENYKEEEKKERKELGLKE
jgi:hypothetical protein